MGPLLTQAESWMTWIFYRWGFVHLYAGLGGYALALARSEVFPATEKCTTNGEIPWLAFYGIAAGIGLLVTWRIMQLIRKDPQAESPFAGRCLFGIGPAA
jgi:hypothetical protein